jgi:hypothetical protein
MHKRIVEFLVIIGTGLFGSEVQGQQERRIQPDAVPFMRVKLNHTKEIVEGLALENFDAIARSAQALATMSLESSWNSFQTTEYIAFSRVFRDGADHLRQAALDHNLDGTTLAFFEVTLSCVQCHKYVRKLQHVETPNDE